MLSISVSGVTCDKRSLCSCYISRDARFFYLNLNAYETMLLNHELELQFMSYVSLKYRILHVQILPAQHDFLLSGATVRCILQSSLSPESLLSLINFGHNFKQIIRCITKCIWSTDIFMVFLSKWNDIIVWIYQQNIVCVTWDTLPCSGIPVLNDARFFIFLLCHIRCQRMAPLSLNTQWFSSLLLAIAKEQKILV